LEACTTQCSAQNVPSINAGHGSNGCQPPLGEHPSATACPHPRPCPAARARGDRAPQVRRCPLGYAVSPLARAAGQGRG
jgi:hypothetical protein